MPDYSFGSLSGRDFEQLVRDLLQAELKVTLESFTAGRDGGVDVRWVGHRARDVLLVQCKQYEGSGYSALRRSLQREAPRIKQRRPARYIVATSLGLTPANKDEIHQLFAPHSQTPSDVLGRDDLNNLLGLHPEVERRHFKLWLTSATVLERVTHARLFGAANSTIEKARRRAARYVHNASFERAVDVLEQRHVCIVAGIPGIGKTTLAEVLLARYADQEGFEVFRIVRDVSEMDAARDPHKRQIFYYDDFLGTTGLELGKSEDRRLLEFMEEVAARPTWRFILTTREYILEAARTRYEALAHAPLDWQTCVVTLEDYTKRVRAEILYNHLYFSDIPLELKAALLADWQYRRIYLHQNYNPRIIEHMTSALHVDGSAAETYLQEFLANLDNPARIWQHAFEHVLTPPARHLLLVRATLPRRVRVADLRDAFWSLHNARRARFGFVCDSNDFLHALKSLDGTFLRTEKSGGETHVLFHNPSVQDFLDRHLHGTPDDVHDLAQTAVFFEQLEALWRGGGGLRACQSPSDAGSGRYSGVDHYADDFGAGLARTFSALPCGVMASRSSQGRVTEWRLYQPAREARVGFVLGVATILGSPIRPAVSIVLQDLEQRLTNHRVDSRSELIDHLAQVTTLGRDQGRRVFDLAHSVLTGDLSSVEDVGSFIEFNKAFPDVVSHEELASARTAFLECYPDDVAYGMQVHDASDFAMVSELASNLGDMARYFDLDLSEAVEQLQQHADELEASQQDEDERRDHRGATTADEEAPSEAIDEMFDRLREQIGDALAESGSVTNT